MIERLYPDREVLKDVKRGAVYEDVVIGERSVEELPFVYINMVSSVDGKVSVDGKSGAIGSDVDRSTMRELRAKADAVMVGSGTVRAEPVSLITEGRSDPEPFAIILSNSLRLPLRENLKDSLKERTLVLTTSGSAKRCPEEDLDEILSFATLVECEESGSGGVDLAEALGRLSEEHGIRTLLLEGGPGLNRAMISAGLVDEVFMTLSPQLLGGNPEESLNMISGDLFEEPVKTDLVSIHRESGSSELFLRYSIQR